MEPPRPVSLGKNFAAGLATLLLVETLCMELLLPRWAATAEAWSAARGRTCAIVQLSVISGAAVFWGVGGLMAVPALMHVRRGKVQPSKDLDYGQLLRALPLVVVNFLLGATVVPPCFVGLLPESSFDARALPSPLTLARDLVVWMVTNELLFFHIHRWFHENKTAYAWVHKIHHSWTAPISIIAIYCHPLEHLLINILPVAVGPVLCGSHIASITVYTTLGLVNTLGIHSGYWHCDDNGLHDEHHAKFNCNYGSMGVLDCWYGSYQLPERVSVATAAADKKAE